MDSASRATWGQVWEQLQILIGKLAFGLGPALSPLNLLATVALCSTSCGCSGVRRVHRLQPFPGGSTGPHRSGLDVKLFLLTWFLGLFTSLNYAAIATITAGRWQDPGPAP